MGGFPTPSTKQHADARNTIRTRDTLMYRGFQKTHQEKRLDLTNTFWALRSCISR